MAIVRTIDGSSNIVSIGYDEEAKELRVEFNNGGVWKYEGVSRAAFDRFSEADSKGAYLHSQIKKAYPSAKVDAQFEMLDA